MWDAKTCVLLVVCKLIHDGEFSQECDAIQQGDPKVPEPFAFLRASHTANTVYEEEEVREQRVVNIV